MIVFSIIFSPILVEPQRHRASSDLPTECVARFRKARIASVLSDEAQHLEK